MNNSQTIQKILALAKANMSVDSPAASEACERVIALAKTDADISAEADARHLLAQVFFNKGKNIEAIEESKKAVELREAAGDLAKASMSLNSLGIYLTQIADYPSALESCFRSLKIKEELNDKKGIASTLINIGSIYQYLNNTEQELKMYERSLQIACEIDDQKLLAYNHLNLGLLHMKMHEYDKALEYLDRIDEVFYSFGDKRNAINALNNQAGLFLDTKQYDKALEKYNRCLELARETGNTPNIINALMGIGELKTRQNLPREGKQFIDQAIELSKKHALKSNLKEAKLVLSDYYASRNNYKKALEEYREHVALKEELLNIQNLRQLGELHLKYDLDKKEKEALINHLKNVELREALDKLQEEKKRSDKLLLNILPEEVAEELKATGTAKAKFFDMVTVMFVDIKDFTLISQRLAPEMVVAEIDFLFRGFDQIIKRFDIEKIKTIGDAYMCAGGIPVPDLKNAENAANASLEILKFIEEMKQKRIAENKPYFEIRIGLNTGPVVAGIVGSSKFAYDIWGDTVNTAARMEQTSEAGKINISGDTYLLLKDKFTCTYRGKIKAKNKGEIDMYFLTQK